jgi:ectoine hydroxylase-related dioxygenase (phytanoyl-CoA dioxygenase family)
MLPTDDDVAFYREHGWYITPKVLSLEAIDRAAEGAERHWAGDRDWPLSISEGFKDWRPGDPDTIRVGEIIALQNRDIRALVEQPIIGAIAARLTGADEIRLWESELIQKPPQIRDAKAAVGWHTDRAYWMTCTSVDMLTAWIPFHDCPKEMGPLMVADGSHRWPELEHDRLREFRNTDLEGMEELLLRDHPGAPKVSMALEKGQLSFHNSLTLHASDFNLSDRPRLSLALHLQDGDNRYREHRNEKGELWRVVADRLCRAGPDGHPDYTDPKVCPVLWSDR